MSKLRFAAGTIVFALTIGVVGFRVGLAASRSAAPRRAIVHANSIRTVSEPARAARAERLRQLRLNPAVLAAFMKRHSVCSRLQLQREGYLMAGIPAQGSGLIEGAHRTAAGDALLQRAKDVLFALLFGDESSHVALTRTHRELLTLTLPRKKSHSLGFLQASTELNAAGNWQDPENASNDEHADNLVVEVEYGETKDESVGNGVIVALRLINLLEVNEQILYARMLDIEQSTLVP